MAWILPVISVHACVQLDWTFIAYGLAAAFQVIEAVNLLLKSATAVKKSKEDVQVSSHYFTCMHITVSSWMVPEVF